LTSTEVQIQTSVHALFYFRNVVNIAFFLPVVHHAGHPARIFKVLEPEFTSQKLGSEHVSFLLHVIDDVVLLLAEERSEATFVSADLFDDVECSG
jgi:hypothetical protein